MLDYVTLAQALVDKCPVIGLSLDAARVPGDMMQIAHLHARTIRKIQPVGAVRVAGWSLGGALAPLIAKVLEDEEREVAWWGNRSVYPVTGSGRYFARRFRPCVCAKPGF